MPNHHISPIEGVPLEVFSIICTSLKKSDLQALSLTSRRIHERTTHELVKSTLHIHIIGKNIGLWRDRFLQKSSILTRGIRDIALKVNVSAKGVQGAFRKGSTDDPALDALAGWKMAAEILPMPSSLHTLQIDQGQTFPHSTLLYHVMSRLPSHCPQLRHLTLNDIHPCLYKGMHLAISGLGNLRSLTITAFGRHSIKNASGVYTPYYQINDVTRRDDATLDALARCIASASHLTSLTLKHYSRGLLGMALGALADAKAVKLAHLFIDERYNGQRSGQSFLEYVILITNALRRLNGGMPSLQEFHLHMIDGWDSIVHLPLLHQACQGSVRKMSFTDTGNCIFPPQVTWPQLEFLDSSRSLGLKLEKGALFPALRILHLSGSEIIGEGDPFPSITEVRYCMGLSQNDLPRLFHRPLPSLLLLGMWGHESLREHLRSLRHVPMQSVQVGYCRRTYGSWNKLTRMLLKEFPNVETFTK